MNCFFTELIHSEQEEVIQEFSAIWVDIVLSLNPIIDSSPQIPY